MENWPMVGDRYDPYDPAHPMWRDPFWDRYTAHVVTPPPKRAEESVVEEGL